MFIAVEGIDGAGTTSFCHNLLKELENNGISATFAHQPSKNNSLGRLIREFLKNPELKDQHEMFALMFAAERIYQTHFWQKELKKGKWVICDRHFWSSIAYQGSLTQEQEWVMDLNRFAKSPDLWVFIDTPIEETEKRRTKRKEDEDLYERRDWQIGIRNLYMALYDREEGKKLMLDGMLGQKELAKTGAIQILKGLEH